MTFENLHLTNDQYIQIIEAGNPIKFIEVKEGGQGETSFMAQSAALIIKANDKPPLVWALKNRKCAEGAFLTFTASDSTYTLHILEMKSKLTAKEFHKVLHQFQGMYLSAISVMAILKIPAPEKVRLYVTFKEEALIESQPYLLKTQVGGETPPGIREWFSSKVNLPHGNEGTIIKGQRVNLNCDFGLV